MIETGWWKSQIPTPKCDTMQLHSTKQTQFEEFTNAERAEDPLTLRMLF